MKENSERLEHALHNELVCDYLSLKEEFSDWIITTAFYSCLQFVSYKIFPFTKTDINGKKVKIESIDDFYVFELNRRTSKHELLSDLVEEKINSVSPDYDWLLSMSKTSRYVNYQHDK